MVTNYVVQQFVTSCILVPAMCGLGLGNYSYTENIHFSYQQEVNRVDSKPN